jgi:hypothetical protein
MIKKIIAGVVLLLAAFAAFVAMQPSDFRISRSLVIAAPSDVIFEQINDPQKMAEWSPWKELDPNAKFTYSGAQAGVGAVSTWAGNADMGEGSATIVESTPNEYVKTRLDFIKPMQATNMAEFRLKSQGEQTEVTWSMVGKNNFIGKAMGLLFNCEEMVGGMFEQGLMNLKNVAEAKQSLPL